MKIPDGWKETIISDVADVNELSVGNNYPYQQIEYIDISSVGTREVLSTQKLNLADAPSRAKRIIRDNDILISTVRPNLKHFCFIKKAKPNHVASTGFAVISSKKCDPVFLYYLLTTNEYTDYLIKIADSQTSTYPAFNSGVISNSILAFPPLPEQKAIADVLSSFDNKIELLREQNKTLEAIAQTIFNEWFVRFNFPDENGKPYQASGGKMIDSELGPIPEGWRVDNLGDVVAIFDSQRIPLPSGARSSRKGQYPYYGATGIIDYIDDYLFDGTFLLFAEDGSVIDPQGLAIIQYVTGKIWVNNHAHVLQGKGDFSTELLYLFSKRLKVAKIITGAVQPKINQDNLLKLKIVISNSGLMKKINSIIQPLFLKIVENNSHIQSLSSLRDELLPKLVKGELRAVF